MKTFRIFSMLVLAIILAACNSNDAIIENPAQPNDDLVHFSGTISLDGLGTRTVLTETVADQTITVDWKVGDKINMCQSDTRYGTAEVKSLSGTSAYIVGTLTSGFDINSNFDLKYLGDSEGKDFNTVLQDRYWNQKGTVGNLSAYDWREGSAKLKLDGSNYVIDGTVKLAAQMAIWKLTLTDGTNPLNMSNTGKTLKVFYDGVQVAGSKNNFAGGSTNIVYLAVPTASSKTIKIEYTDGTFTYVYQKSGVSIAASKYYQSTVTLNGMLSKQFSVGSSKKVWFANGNLQKVNGAWRFAAHQYDYYGESQSDSQRDLFAFNNYSSPSGDASWYALSLAEWDYLLNSRSVTNSLSANARYTLATLGGSYKGMIVFPDVYNHPAEATVSGSPVYDAASDYTATIALADWAKMEKAGAMFLPAAGYYSKANEPYSYVDVGTGGSYTSTTVYTDYNNYDIYFKADVVRLTDNSNKNSLLSVRMVCDAGGSTEGFSSITGGGSKEWVQLWAGGPKWAKFNVGSTISTYAGVTEYNLSTVGGHYSYRGKTDNSADAGAVDDTAKYFWGSNWATPTKDQLQALLDNCTWTLCDGTIVQYEPGCTLVGYKLSGKGTGYTGNSIFLPYAGINDQNYYGVSVIGSRGVFWSLNAGGSGAYYLNEGQHGQSVMDHNQPHGCSVRAICIE